MGTQEHDNLLPPEHLRTDESSDRSQHTIQQLSTLPRTLVVAMAVRDNV